MFFGLSCLSQEIGPYDFMTHDQSQKNAIYTSVRRLKSPRYESDEGNFQISVTVKD